MLSHALGATKSTSSGGNSSKTLPIKQVASYVNEKVHDFSSTIIAKHDETPSQSCMFDLEEFVSCVPPDIWEMMLKCKTLGGIHMQALDAPCSNAKTIVRRVYCACVYECLAARVDPCLYLACFTPVAPVASL